jgi:hypothetical protein
MLDIVAVMDTTVGKPADILQTLAEQGVPVLAGCLFPRAEGRIAHIAVEDEHEPAVRRVASDHGALVLDAREVLVVDPGPYGGAAAVARLVADAGAVVHVAYFGAQGQIILATSDIELARTALEGELTDPVTPEADRTSI